MNTPFDVEIADHEKPRSLSKRQRLRTASRCSKRKLNLSTEVCPELGTEAARQYFVERCAPQVAALIPELRISVRRITGGRQEFYPMIFFLGPMGFELGV